MNIREKIKIFISSKCGVEKYDIVREALKCRLEDTGFMDVYVFESTGAYSKSAVDSYLGKLDDCDLVIFLIDNEDDDFPEGVMKEYLRAKHLEKKSIYLFFNKPEKEETTIQKSLYGPNGTKFTFVNSIKEFIDKGYQSVIEDIFSIYKDYCKGRLNNIGAIDADIVKLDEGANTILNEIEKYQMKKSLLSKFPNIYKYFKMKNKFYRKHKSQTFNDMEKQFLYFAELLLCKEEHNDTEMNTLMKLIIESHLEDNRDVIAKRWESIQFCYNDNLQGAVDRLDEAYKEGIKKNIDEWILNDILIDKRNLENLLNNEKNIIKESEAQKILNNKENILHCPVLDRVSNGIYNSIIEEINKIEMSTPYISHVGTGINKILGSVSEYFIWAVYYGSYTHMEIVIKLLQDIFYNFYKLYNVNEWGFEALQYSIINENTKIIKDITDRNSNIISACSKDKINYLYYLSDKIHIKNKRNKMKINVFNYLGYYFSDSSYKCIENEIFILFNEWLYSDNSSVYLGQVIFDAIRGNINRLNKSKIENFLISVLNRKYYRFYDDVFKIIQLIPFDEINEDRIIEIIDIVINIVKDERQRFKYNNLEYCIIHLRKTGIEYSSRLDEIVEEFWGELKETYSLEVLDNEVEYRNSILKYVEEIKHRNSVQGKGSYYGYGYNPQDIIKNILKITKDNLLNNKLLQIITDACKECLMNEKQIISEKISSIQLLIYLKRASREQHVMFDWNKYYSLLNEEKILKGYSDNFFNKDSNLTLMSNYILYKIVNNDEDENEILDLLSYYNDNNVYENIKVLEAIKTFMVNSEMNRELKNIYIILMQFISRYIKDKNYEVKYRVVDCLFGFIGKSSNEIVYKYIDRISDDLDYRVKLSILNNIDEQEEKNIFKYVIEKYLVDNNYLVRSRAKRILN